MNQCFKVLLYKRDSKLKRAAISWELIRSIVFGSLMELILYSKDAASVKQKQVQSASRKNDIFPEIKHEAMSYINFQVMQWMPRNYPWFNNQWKWVGWCEEMRNVFGTKMNETGLEWSWDIFRYIQTKLLQSSSGLFAMYLIHVGLYWTLVCHSNLFVLRHSVSNVVIVISPETFRWLTILYCVTWS